MVDETLDALGREGDAMREMLHSVSTRRARSRTPSTRWWVSLGLLGAGAFGSARVGSSLLSLVVGGSPHATIATAAAVLGWMSLGAWWCRARDPGRVAPLRTLVMLQLVGAAWITATPWLVSSALATSMPTSTWIVVAPAPLGIATGAALPLTVEAWSRTRSDRGVGAMIAAYALGACAAALAMATPWVARFGLSNAAVVAAATTVLGCLALGGLARRTTSATASRGRVGRHDAAGRPPPATDPARVAPAWLASFTGALAIGVDLVGTAALGPIVGGTHRALALTAVAILGGAALGATLRHGLGARGSASTWAWTATIGAAVGGVLLSAAVRHDAPGLGWAALAIVAAGLGALFATFAQLHEGRDVAPVVAFAHLGGVGGALGGGLGLLPRLGPTAAWWLLFAPAAATAATLGALARAREGPQLAALTAGAAALLVGAQALEPRVSVPGWVEIDRRRSALGLATVVEGGATPPGAAAGVARRLVVDVDFGMGGTRAFAAGRMGRIPVALHPDPSTVLVLGIGTGATAGATLATPIDRLDAVELDPAILELLPWFASSNHRLHADPRVTRHAADARSFVARPPDGTPGRWDVIITDLVHPHRVGAGRLFAREHLERVRDSLAPGGIHVHWLPLHQLDPHELRRVIRTFVDVFGDAPLHAWLAAFDPNTPALGLMGHARGGPRSALGAAPWAARQRDDDARRLDLVDPARALAGHVLDGPGLRAFAGSGPLETDLTPTFAWTGPAPATAGLRGRANLIALRPHRARLDPASLGVPPSERPRWAAIDAALWATLESGLSPPRP